MDGDREFYTFFLLVLVLVLVFQSGRVRELEELGVCILS